MHISWLPLRNTIYVLQIRNLSALNDLDHQPGIDYLPDECTLPCTTDLVWAVLYMSGGNVGVHLIIKDCTIASMSTDSLKGFV